MPMEQFLRRPALHGFLKAVLRRPRKAYRGSQAAAGRLAKDDARAVALGDGLDDGQSEACTAFLGCGAAVEAIEYALPVRRCDPGTGIDYLEHRLVRGRVAAHLDRSMQRRIAHRIVDQVSHQHPKCFTITADYKVWRCLETQINMARHRKLVGIPYALGGCGR